MDITSFMTTTNEWITSIVGGNQFAAAALIAVLTSSVVFVLRNIPAALLQFVINQSITTMRINNAGLAKMSLFVRVVNYIHTHADKKFSRKFSAERFWNHQNNHWVTSIAVGLGWHRFKFEGKWIFVHRSEYKDNHGDEVKEYIDIIVLGRSTGVLNRFLEACQPKEDNAEVKIFDYRVKDREWESVGSISGGGLDNCALDANVRDFFETEFTKFENNRDVMLSMGLSHKLTMVIHGSPGSGKTSLVRALAKQFKYNIYSVNLGTLIMAPTELLGTLMASVPKRSIILMDDFDDTLWVAARLGMNKTVKNNDSDAKDKDKEAKAGSGYGGKAALLNCLDGIVPLDDVIIMALTNVAGELDKAIIRPGRVDHVVELPVPSTDTVKDHLQSVWPDLVSMPDVRYSQLPGCILYKIKRMALNDHNRAAELINYYHDNPSAAVEEQNGELEALNPFGNTEGDTNEA